MISSYLCILEDSLVKKLELLKRIEEKSLEQSVMIKDNHINPDLMDKNMDEKLKMIEEINSLDDGFEALYGKIKKELEEKKEQYKSQIRKLQGLIEKITEKSSSIQAIEARNKSQMDLYFTKQKKELQSRKSAMSVARDYYQNMNKVKHVSPQFLDHKKQIKTIIRSY